MVTRKKVIFYLKYLHTIAHLRKAKSISFFLLLAVYVHWWIAESKSKYIVHVFARWMYNVRCLHFILLADQIFHCRTFSYGSKNATLYYQNVFTFYTYDSRQHSMRMINQWCKVQGKKYNNDNSKMNQQNYNKIKLK